ncbi:MAG: hypothetical protein RMI45_01210 [Ignisphaera sp.]|nr:hypothetical protein [Ignisphaera sp.]MDW8084846.1 hypothetical protein [Ignisphaera sp.]
MGEVVGWIAERFTMGVRDCKTIDCVLIKLTTAVCEIRDYVEAALESRYSSSALVHSFLSDPDVMKILAGLSHERRYVEAKILSDPRFSPLRIHLQLLLSAIDVAAEKGVKPYAVFRTDTRAPTWQIEYLERYSNSPHKETHLGSSEYMGGSWRSRNGRRRVGRVRNLLSWRKIMVVIGLLAAAVAIVVLALLLLQSVAI